MPFTTSNVIKALEAALLATNQEQEQKAVNKGGHEGPFKVNLSTNNCQRSAYEVGY